MLKDKKVLFALASGHVFLIALGNYLTQFPLTLCQAVTTWGMFTFPFIFLLTDVTVRLMGSITARRVIFLAMFPALVLSYLFSVLFVSGKYVGAVQLWGQQNLLAARIAVGSFIAYIAGQLLDILVFNRLRQYRQWWIAPLGSATIGGAIDTALFVFIAFYHSQDSILAEKWIEIGCVDYGFKLLSNLIFLGPIYRFIVNWCTQRKFSALSF